MTAPQTSPGPVQGSAAEPGLALPRFRVETLPFEISIAFRRGRVPHPDLVADVWDAAAEHVGLFVGDTLTATFRIVHARDGRLPVSDHLNEGGAVDSLDVQLGRFVADRPSLAPVRREAFMAFFLVYFGEFIRAAPRQIYAPLLKGGAFSMHRFLCLGFTDTGARYFDERYGEELAVLVKKASAPCRVP